MVAGQKGLLSRKAEQSWGQPSVVIGRARMRPHLKGMYVGILVPRERTVGETPTGHNSLASQSKKSMMMIMMMIVFHVCWTLSIHYLSESV